MNPSHIVYSAYAHVGRSMTLLAWWSAAPPDNDGGREDVTRGRPAELHEPASDITHIPARVMGGVPVEHIMARLRAGDEAVLELVFRECYTSLCRLGLLLTRSHAAAEEIAQEVLLSVWTRRATLEMSTDLRVYLLGAVRHLAAKWRRHNRVVAETAHAVERNALTLPGMGRAMQTPDRAAEVAEFATAYEHALAMLAERDRVALRLRWEEGMTFDDIGVVLGVSKVSARAIVLRGQGKVQEALVRFRG